MNVRPWQSSHMGLACSKYPGKVFDARSALKEFGESVVAESTVTARRPSLLWG